MHFCGGSSAEGSSAEGSSAMLCNAKNACAVWICTVLLWNLYGFAMDLYGFAVRSYGVAVDLYGFAWKSYGFGDAWVGLGMPLEMGWGAWDRRLFVFGSFSCLYVVFYNENAICVGGFAMSKHELFDFHGKKYRFCYVFGELGVWLTRNI